MNRKTIRINKSFWIFFMMLLAAVFLTACRREQEIVEITVIHGWGSNEDDHIAMRQIYSDFEKENPDVKVNLLSMSSSEDLARKVGDMILTGKIPDVIYFGGGSNTPVYDYMISNGLALDLMPFIQDDEELAANVSDLNYDCWMTEDHKLYTLSDTLLYSGGYWYNEEIFAQAGIEKLPQSWEEFTSVCEKIALWSEKGNNSVTPLAVSAEGYLYFLDHMLVTNGGSMGAGIAQRELLFNRQEFTNVVDQLRDIFTYSTANDDHYSYRDETDLFNEGKVAMYINGVWGAPMISGEITARYALLPAEGTSTMSCVSAGIGYVLGNTGSKAREEAGARFLAYMLSDMVQERVLSETQQVPASPNIRLDHYKEEMPRFYQAAETVQEAEIKIGAPATLWSTEQESVFMGHILNVLEGTMENEELAVLMEKEF